MEAKLQADNASETLILKLALRYTDSERVVALPPSITVEALLAIALSVFDFLGGHLSKITRKDGWTSTVRPDFDGSDDFEGDKDEDVWPTSIGDFLPVRGAKATIDYDFGDGWEIVVTRMADKATAEPFTCIKTQGLDAIEDCGGPWGLSEIYTDLAHWIDASKAERAAFDSERLDWAFELGSLTEKKARALLAPPTSAEISSRLQ